MYALASAHPSPGCVIREKSSNLGFHPRLLSPRPLTAGLLEVEVRFSETHGPGGTNFCRFFGIFSVDLFVGRAYFAIFVGMRRISTIFLLAALSSVAQRNDWYEPCLLAEPGITVLGTMPQRPARVNAHIRIRQPEPHARASATLAWNAADSLNYSYARLSLTGHDDDIYLGKAVLTIGAMKAGIDCPAEEHAFDPSTGYESVQLIYDGFSARVRTKAGTYAVGYATEGPSGVWLIADSQIMCQRLTALGDAMPGIETADYESEEALMESIRASADKAEGLWEYMDRDIRPGSASLGGHYVLATVKSPGGGYDIVYMGGAEANSALWRPLAIKGHLSPTIFSGNFDMRWTDADGNTLQRDCNAQLDPNGAILTLRFPLQSAQLRLRRIMPSR